MNCQRCGAPIQPGYVRCVNCGMDIMLMPQAQYPMYAQVPYPKASYPYLPPTMSKKPVSAKWWFWMLLVCGVLAVFLIAMIASTHTNNTAEKMSEEEYKLLCSESFNYDALMRDPNSYIGEKYKIELRVAQVVQGSKPYYRCYANSRIGWSLDYEYYIEDAREDSSVKLLEDDFIIVYGEFAGLETIKRVIGTSDEVPKIVMRYCDLEEQKEFSEQVLFENERIKITATGIDLLGFSAPKLLILIENNTDQNITVQCRDSSVNGFAVSTFISKDVPAGKSSNADIGFSRTDIDNNGITRIEVLEFRFLIFNTDTWEDIVESDIISVVL